MYAEARGLGTVFLSSTGFILARDPDTVRAPAIAFVAANRLSAGEEMEGFLPFAPDLAVAVVALADRATDVLSAVWDYATAGTRLIVLVEPRRRVVLVFGPDHTARLLGVADTFDGGDMLPGFRLPVAPIVP